MKYITVNPTWNVPQSIIHNEYLPALPRIPRFSTRMGLRCVRPRRLGQHLPSRPERAMRSAASASTSRTSSRSISTTRRTNTCSRSRAPRCSHGCMRVQNPDQYAEVLLRIANPQRRLHAPSASATMYGTGERDIQLQYQIPVHLTYQTAYRRRKRPPRHPRGHLWPRRQADLAAQERRAPVADQPTASDRREASAASSAGAARLRRARRQVMRQAPELRVLRPVPLSRSRSDRYEIGAPPQSGGAFFVCLGHMRLSLPGLTGQSSNLRAIDVAET